MPATVVHTNLETRKRLRNASLASVLKASRCNCVVPLKCAVAVLQNSASFFGNALTDTTKHISNKYRTSRCLSYRISGCSDPRIHSKPCTTSRIVEHRNQRTAAHCLHMERTLQSCGEFRCPRNSARALAKSFCSVIVLWCAQLRYAVLRTPPAVSTADFLCSNS